MSVVVVVADGHTVAISTRQSGDPRRTRDILECAVPPVTEQPIARRRATGIGGESPPLYEVDVEPAVAVVVDQPATAARRLGELREGGGAVIESVRR